MRFLPLVLLAAACGGGSESPPDAPDSVDADSGVSASPDLGKSCAMGCNLDTCVSTTSPDCENQTCVWDGRGPDFGDAYCSQSCAGTDCPTGYTCLSADDGTGQFCFANPAVCGNSIIERGEVCDAGASNGMAMSGCAADCEDTIGGGRAAFTFDATPIILEGTSSEGDRVSSSVNDEIVQILFSAGELDLGLTILTADLAGPFPTTVLGRVSFTDVFNAWCYGNPPDGLGMVITVTEWTASTHIAGSFDGTLTYERCTTSRPDPTVFTHVISASSFDVFLEQD